MRNPSPIVQTTHMQHINFTEEEHSAIHVKFSNHFAPPTVHFATAVLKSLIITANFLTLVLGKETISTSLSLYHL